MSIILNNHRECPIARRKKTKRSDFIHSLGHSGKTCTSLPLCHIRNMHYSFKSKYPSPFEKCIANSAYSPSCDRTDSRAPKSARHLVRQIQSHSCRFGIRRSAVRAREALLKYAPDILLLDPDPGITNVQALLLLIFLIEERDRSAFVCIFQSISDELIEDVCQPLAVTFVRMLLPPTSKDECASG